MILVEDEAGEGNRKKTFPRLQKEKFEKQLTQTNNVLK